MNTPSTYTFKAHCASRDETRLFILPKSDLSFKTLSSRLADLFGTSNLHVQYLDDENDHITIKTDKELVAAVQFFSGKPSVRLIISTKLEEPEVVKIEASTNTVAQNKTEPMLLDGIQAAEAVVAVVAEEAHVQPQCSPSSEEEKKKLRRECSKAEHGRRELGVAMGPALKQLEEMGFTKKGACVRLLIKFDGDVQKVAEEMRAWQLAHDLRKEQKHAQKKELKRLEKEEKRALKQQLREKKEKYKSEKRAAKMALKEEKKKKKDEKKSWKYAKEEGHAHHHRHHWVSDEEMTQLGPKLKQLEEMGVTRSYKAIRLLTKLGDVEKVASILQTQKCGKRQEEWKALEDKHKEALAVLAGRGFPCKRRNIRLLERTGNDIEKVVDLLTMIEERKKKKRHCHQDDEMAHQHPVASQPVLIK
jgi:hypothetical protein